jgi:hypothetical protein
LLDDGRGVGGQRAGDLVEKRDHQLRFSTTSAEELQVA